MSQPQPEKSPELNSAQVLRKVRMLVLSSDLYPPTRVDVSVLFGEELARRGHEVDWILQSEKARDRSSVEPWGGGRIWVGRTDLRDGLVNRILKHVYSIAHDLKVFPLLRRGDYQIVEVKDKFLSGLYAVIAARMYGKRFVYWLSYPFPEDYLYRSREPTARYRFLYRVRGAVFSFLLYRVLLPRAYHVFVQSDQMLRDVAAHGIPVERMTAVPMGVRVSQEEPPAARERTVIPQGVKCFMYLGTLGRVRRMDFLIRVLALVRQSIPEIRLYLVGSGNDAEDERILRDEAIRLNVLDAVVFVGQLPQQQALQYVLDADVCVSPIYPTPILNAGSPTKLVEYMAMEKAVVANDHPDQRLILEESGAGYCVEFREEPFAAAIVRLLNDPETARAMGKRGRRYVKEHRSYARLADVVERQLIRIAHET